MAVKELKVLHIVANLRHGGVQTWVIQLMNQLRREGVSMDLLTYSDQQWPLESQVIGNGGRIFACTNHRNPLALYRAIRDLNTKYGPYDAIHAHEMFNNGLSLHMAKILGIPVRISHSHNSSQGVRTTLRRHIYNRAMQWSISQSATHLLAVSELSGARLYGKRWSTDKRARLVHCGLDFSPYSNVQTESRIRDEVGIPAEALVIGHVGRMVMQKNHKFLVQVAFSAMQANPNLWLVLVGDGELRSEIQKDCIALGIAERVKFLGARDDVPKIIAECFDLFLLTSLFEGLGLVLLEAQAAGIPCLISDVVPLEADVIPSLVRRMSLDDSAASWAEEALRIIKMPPSYAGREAVSIMRNSPFDIGISAQTMLGLYR